MKRHVASMAIALLLISGCAHNQPRADGTDTKQQESSANPADQMGPPAPSEGSMGPEAPMGPLPTSDFVAPKEGYVLVLGPGLARGLAYLGVLRELESRNVQIRAVVGVEVGAMVAGIWASSNLNNLEWEMHKFKRDTLLDFPILGLRGRVAEGNRLYEFLDGALKVNLLQKMKVPLLVASAVPQTSTILVESNGSAKDIIRGAMGIPGILKTFNFEGKERETAALETPFPVIEAKALNLGKVICVDAIGRGDNFLAKDQMEVQLATLMRSVAALARQELKDCDVVISIALDGASYLNFDAKADLINQGKVAVRKWLEPGK